MDLNALGNIGDFLGGIGVIVTLAYLAVQIRRNTASTLHASYLQNLAAAAQYANLVGGSSEAASVLRRGMQDFESLSDDERIQFDGVLCIALLAIEGHFYSWRQGLYADPSWEPVRRNLSSLLRQPGVREWWDTSRPNINPDFAQYIGEQLNAPMDEESGWPLRKPAV